VQGNVARGITRRRTLKEHVHSRGYDHSALLYHSEREYVDTLTPFIAEGLDQQQPVLVAVPGDRLDALLGALGSAAADVTTADMTSFGRNPGRILAGQFSFVERHPDRRVRIVAEPAYVGRTESEYVACMQHEALANIAFSASDITTLCPYDASCLDRSVLDHVRLTHPEVWLHGSRRRCPEYAVDAALEQCNQPLVSSPAAVTHTVERALDLAGARRCAERYGRLLGMAADRVADLLLITTELATNSLNHADGPCRLAFWYDDGFVICEARDIGRWEDPLAGRRPPGSGGVGPYGLFVVNAIADLLRTHTSSAGTTVHAYLRRDDPSAAAS
jgi:anti-sigma regulatory factor (Ser/Thr protein kinase)